MVLFLQRDKNMFLRKYKYLIVATFMGIFIANMGISFAPVFFNDIDKEIMNAVIMQIELEHENGNDSGKQAVKFIDLKFMALTDSFISYEFLSANFNLNNDFIEHFKRYVNPHHPAVPTPPPNFI